MIIMEISVALIIVISFYFCSENWIKKNGTKYIVTIVFQI